MVWLSNLGVQPVADDIKVMIKYNCGIVPELLLKASDWIWEQAEGEYGIAEYQIVEEN